MSDVSQGEGWWQASDGKWYPPTAKPGVLPPPPNPYGQQSVYAPGPYQTYGAPPMQQSTNGYAVAALVLGIVWIYGIGAILALIFGYKARKEIDQSQGRQTGRGMATAGIVLGWIGIAGIVFIIFIVVLGSAASDSYYYG